MTRYSTFSVTSPSEENSNIYNFQLHVQVQLGINLPSDYLYTFGLAQFQRFFLIRLHTPVTYM